MITTPSGPQLSALVINGTNGTSFELQVSTSFSIESYLVVDSVMLIESGAAGSSRAMQYSRNSSGASYEGTTVNASLVVQVDLADDGANFTVLVSFHAADTPDFKANVSSGGSRFSFYAFFGSALLLLTCIIMVFILIFLILDISKCTSTRVPNLLI